MNNSPTEVVDMPNEPQMTTIATKLELGTEGSAIVVITVRILYMIIEKMS